MDLSAFNGSGYEVTEIDTEIFLVKDFITEEERSYIHQIAENTDEDTWSFGYIDSLRRQCLEKYGTEDYTVISEIRVNPFWIDKTLTLPDHELSNTLTARMAAFFDPSFSLRPFANIQRQKTGVALDEHFDRGHDDRLRYASVLYLNEDYTEGELYFPDRGLVLRPPARSLIIFSADKDYVHGVKPVGEGPTRYVITSFVWTEDGAM